MTKFDNERHNRYGGEVDKEQLEKILPKLGFKVTVCENKTKPVSGCIFTAYLKIDNGIKDLKTDKI